MKTVRHHQSRRSEHVDLVQRADRVMKSTTRLVVQRRLSAAKLHYAASAAEKRSALKWPSGD
jgi:hypothetical protein